MSNSAFQITLPKSWPTVVRSAMLHVVSLAKYAAVYTRSWAADSSNARVRLRAEADRLQQEIALLREELRIKDARMASVPPHRRPFYEPTERLAILELSAMQFTITFWTLPREFSPLWALNFGPGLASTISAV